MNNNIYDVIIVGSGPAGMTAGIYAIRRAMKTLIISQEIGGQMAKTVMIENYPSIEKTNGIDLALKMQKQAKNLGVEFKTDEVKKITKQNNIFILTGQEKTYRAKTVILASGLERKKLGLANENKFIGHGLSYCLTCDGPLFKNKKVAVVGGGNAGAKAVEFITEICPQVYWLEAMDHLNAEQILIDRIKNLKQVEILLSAQITQLLGEQNLTGLKIKTPQEEREINIQGLIVEIGYLANTDWLKDLVDLDKAGQIKVNQLCHTSLPGLFAVGDVTQVKYKQIVVAQGMAATAALEAYEYLQKT